MSTFLIYLEGTSLKSIEFDAVPKQQHTHAAEVTEHEVEKGSNISDHVRPRAEVLKLSCVLSDTPLRGAPSAQVSGQTSKLFKGVTPLVSASRTIAAQKSAAESKGQNPEAGRWRTVYERLQLLKNEGTLCTVVTTPKNYKDMVLVSIDAPHDSSVKDGLRVELEFKQIRLVETATSKVQLRAKDNSGKEKVNTGPQTPRPPDTATAAQATSKSDALKLASAVANFN